MNLSVVIPSKTSSNLIPCVEAIRRNEGDIRIIVVDNGLTHRVAGCEYIDWFKPFVFAAACNAGIRAAGNDNVCLTNDDALLESPGGFRLLQRAAEENPEVGLVGAVTNLTGQPRQYRQHGTDAGLRIVPHIAFVCVMLPRRTLDVFGLLDEDYCIDYGVEDRAYCETLARGGMKIAVHDGCYVDHGSLTSTFRGDPKASRSFAKNYEVMMRKFGGKLIT